MLKFIKSFLTRIKRCQKFSNIFAAKVIAIEKHHNADKLRVIKLILGNKEVYPIVCGAFNFKIGDMVALALPGARIAQNIHADNHQEFILDKATIRGIESQGMICAAFELGLSTEPDKGILILKEGIKHGSQFNEEMIK